VAGPGLRLGRPQQRQYTAELGEERRKAARDDVKILRIMTGMIGQALPNVQQIAPDMSVMEFVRFTETTMRLRRNLFGSAHAWHRPSTIGRTA
jgi:hypothetical protein